MHGKTKQVLTILLLGAFLLCFAGCGKAAPPESPRSVSLQTCAETSGLEMAETENGYYSLFDGLLRYADKSDLTSWVPVCNKPDCEHTDDACPAYVRQQFFYLKDNRIYTTRSPIAIASANGEHIPQSQRLSDAAVYSTALDGTDMRMEYDLSPILPNGTAMSYQPAAGMDGIYYSTSVLQNDGSYLGQIVRLDDTGFAVLYTGDFVEAMSPSMDSTKSRNGMQGDFAVYSLLLNREPLENPNGDFADLYDSHLYRFTEDGYEEISNICQYDRRGAYLKGNDFYHFIPGEGYYHTDLGTGASEKWMEAQLPDSRAYHYGTDFIVETNLADQEPPETPELRIYSGNSWSEIPLPEGLFPEGASFSPYALSQEYFFFIMGMYDGTRAESHLYRIPLTGDPCTPELCTSNIIDFSHP